MGIVNFHSIKFKTAGPLILLLFIALVVVYIFIKPIHSKNEIEKAAATQLKDAMQIAEDIDGHFVSAINEIESLAAMPDMASLNKIEIDRALKQANATTQFFNYFFVVDRRGKWFSFPTNPSNVGQGIPQRNMGWVNKTFSENKTIFLEPVISSINTLVSGFSTPIHTKDHKSPFLLRGVLVLSEENIVQKILMGTHTDQCCGKYIVSASGNLVAHTGFKPAPSNYKELKYSQYPPVAALMSGESGTVTYEYEGIRWLAGYHPIKSTGWGIVVQIPEDEVLAKVRNEVALLTVFSVAFFFAAAVVISVVLHYSLKPLMRLLHEIKANRFSVSEARYADDEIGQLAKEFTFLYGELSESEEKLKKLNEGLEERVRQRTENLKNTNRLLEDEIGQRITAENQLKRSEDRFRTLFNQASDCILLLSPRDEGDAIIEDANYAACTMHGYDREELIGKPITFLDAPDSAQKVPDRIKLIKEGKIVTFEVDHVRKDGSTFPVEVSTHLIYLDGKPYIQAIDRDITARKVAEQKIRTALEEKEILLRELHHRVKNNMQLIISLLRLESDHTDERDPAELFRESCDRIRAMSLVHERLYMAKDMANVDIREYIRDLASNIFRSYVIDTNRIRIDIKVDVREQAITLDTAMPCGLLINELITNCVKHAFPDSRTGMVRVSLQELDPESVQLTVSDDGIGLPVGFNPSGTKSLGMQLIRILAETQLSGNLTIESHNGTVFKVTFKPPKYSGRI